MLLGGHNDRGREEKRVNEGLEIEKEQRREPEGSKERTEEGRGKEVG